MARQALGLPVGSWVIIAISLLSGVFHLVNPAAFLWIMPPWLPEPILLIYLSGVAEILASIGLLLRVSGAPIFTALVLLGVWPANWWLAFDSLDGEPLAAVLAWLRLPLQIPLIIWALRSPVDPKPEPRSKT